MASVLLQLELVSEASAGRDVRWALEHLVGEVMRSDDGPDVLLLTTELVTNAVRHGSGDAIAVRAERHSSGVRVEVVNGGVKGAPRPVEGGPDGGWGLQLIEQLSDEWGREAVDGRTHVWFELRRPRVEAGTAGA